ncbi:MAG: DNA methylase [Bacteroidetes bacterium GWA2_32_17]|nr:MAG: DNA methylase [Bacteroidetes bacterium GWA2_32_17]
MTLSEVLLWNELKQKKILNMDFDRQRPILNYIVDFYCKDLMLAIEVDGSSHNNKYEQDKIRQQELENEGVSFLRFDDLEVKKDMGNVLLVIENWIKTEVSKNGLMGREEPTPNPSKEGN